MGHASIKFNLSFFLFFFSVLNTAYGQAVVQFDTTNYNIKAGYSTSICMSITNGDFSLGGYRVAVKTIDSSLPHFPGQEYKEIYLRTSQHCFTITAGMPVLQDSINQYTFSLVSLDSLLDAASVLGVTKVTVSNYNAPTYLGPKELLFVGYDNSVSISGSDEIVIFNIAPITLNTTFSLTNAVPTDITGRIFSAYNDTLISSLQIEYIDSATIHPFSKISFEIVKGADLGISDSLANFKINGAQSSKFSVTKNGGFTGTKLNLQSSNGSALTMLSGQLDADSNGVYALNGNIIDGIVFQPDSIQESVNNYLGLSNFDINGLSFGLLKCIGDKYLCDYLSTTTNSSSWYHSTGTNADDLVDSMILDSCIMEICPETDLSIVQVATYDSLDIIFLLDDSRSIDSMEYEDMHSSISDIIYELANLVPNTRFAVVHFAEAYNFDVTVPFTFDPSEATNFSQVFDGGEVDVGGAVNNIMDEITLGQLALRQNAQFHLLIFTDALGWLFLSNEYDPYNTIKSMPYESLVSTIRYQQNGPASNPIAASTTSTGGSYFGPLDPNPNDPCGVQLPRRFYMPEEFDNALEELVDDLFQTNYLYAEIDSSCIDPFYEWLASDGGEIESDNGVMIETNNEGTYILNVLCEGSCTYTDTFEFELILPFQSPNSNQIQPWESNDIPPQLGFSEPSSIRLIVNPTISDALFNVNYYSVSTEKVYLDIFDSNGRIVKRHMMDSNSSDGFYVKLNLEGLSDGLYIIRATQNQVRKFERIIKMNR